MMIVENPILLNATTTAFVLFTAGAVAGLSMFILGVHRARRHGRMGLMYAGVIITFLAGVVFPVIAYFPMIWQEYGESTATIRGVLG